MRNKINETERACGSYSLWSAFNESFDTVINVIGALYRAIIRPLQWQPLLDRTNYSYTTIYANKNNAIGITIRRREHFIFVPLLNTRGIVSTVKLTRKIDPEFFSRQVVIQRPKRASCLFRRVATLLRKRCNI